jgi:ankyrin repeat protein
MAELRFTDDNGMSALHHAIVNGYSQLVKILINQDVNLLYMEVEDSIRNTSLHLIA